MDLHSAPDPEHANGSSSQPDFSYPLSDTVDDPSVPLKVDVPKILSSVKGLRIAQSRVRWLGDGGLEVRSGGYADVVPATLELELENGTKAKSRGDQHVAVKKVRYGSDDDCDRVLARFTREVDLLSSLSHDNVVTFLGFVEDLGQGVLWMIFPWEKDGNLREFVRSANWELPERISLINDVARGLAYLHGRQPPICHGDLKSLNVLINEEHRAVITDFGSAHTVDIPLQDAMLSATSRSQGHAQAQDGMQNSFKAELTASMEFITVTGPGWTMRWAAPELLLEGESSSLASDIWALGWIFWEGITGNFPFNDEDQDVQVMLRITKGDLPKLETDDQLAQVKALCSLMMECWKVDANARPSALKCQQRLGFMDMAVPSQNVGTRSAGLLIALGRIHLRNGAPNQALSYTGSALEIAKSAGDVKGEAIALFNRGNAFRLGNEYSKAEEAYEEALSKFSRVGDHLGSAKSIQSLGHVHRAHNHCTEAEDAYSRARDIFDSIGDQLGFAQCAQSLGHIHRMRNQYIKAELAYAEARDIFLLLGNQIGYAHCVQSFGHLHRMRDQYTRAEEAYTEARDIFSRVGDHRGFAQCVQSLGHVYHAWGEYNKAEQAYAEARDVYYRVGEQLGFAQSLQGLGDVYRSRNQYAKAQGAHMEAREIFCRIGNQRGLAACEERLEEVASTMPGEEP